MPREGMSIGQLAARVHLRPSALRYYEDIGLIPPPERVGGARRYPPTTIRRVALIKMAQRAGLHLNEIRALITGTGANPSSTRQWRALAERKLPEIDAMVANLRQLREIIANCLDCGCMNFDTCELLNRSTERPS